MEAVVPSGVREPVPEGSRAGRHAGYATADGRRGRAALRSVSADCGAAHDQAGESSFAEFLSTSWRAGVVRYEVDLLQRVVTYYGCNGEAYAEHYRAVEVP